MLTKPIHFGARLIGPAEPVLIIAEIGINHEGSAERCARMIQEAVTAGADAIKLQTIDADKNYAPDTESYRIFKSAELGPDETENLFRLCRDLGAEPFTTAGDLSTIEWIDRIEPAGYKISSGLLTCTPIIKRAAQTGRPVLMSTGMATVEDIDLAVETVSANDCSFALMQCTSLYPAPLETLDLASIGWLGDKYKISVGFSDHSVGTEAAALAVAAGATIIEKHFSLDPSQPGYDHRLSLDPSNFREMTDGIRRAELARGSSQEKRLLPQLEDVRSQMSRYLGTIRPLSAGEILNETNVGFLRLSDNAGALPASAFDDVVGKHAKSDLLPYSVLTKVSFKNG